MAGRAAGGEMAGAALHHRLVVQRRHLDTHRMGLDGIPHGPMEEPVGDRPVAGAGSDVEQAGPGERESASREHEREDHQMFQAYAHGLSSFEGKVSSPLIR